MAAAARTLRVSSPTISVQVRQLESKYDKTLLARDGKRLVLTEVGKALLRYADG